MAGKPNTAQQPDGQAQLTIDVLALQGAFAEHVTTLRGLGVRAVEVRLPTHLVGLDGLIIPGGESTTIGKLATSYDVLEELRAFVASGRPVYGICAGLVMLANHLDQEQSQIGGMDISVRRNAFGRQMQSFEQRVSIPMLGDAPFPAIFIRAPLITAVGPDVEVLARISEGGIVGARQGSLLVTAFHPELSGDNRLHTLFLEMCSLGYAHQPTRRDCREGAIKGQDADPRKDHHCPCHNPPHRSLYSSLLTSHPRWGILGLDHPTWGGPNINVMHVIDRREDMLPQYKKEAALRLKVAAGHLEGVRRMVDNDQYCVDLMKQLAAVQGTLEGVQRILLRNHLSSCVADAIANGMGEQIIDELMGALKYDKSLIDGRGTLSLEGVLAGEAGTEIAAHSEESTMQNANCEAH